MPRRTIDTEKEEAEKSERKRPRVTKLAEAVVVGDHVFHRHLSIPQPVIEVDVVEVSGSGDELVRIVTGDSAGTTTAHYPRGYEIYALEEDSSQGS